MTAAAPPVALAAGRSTGFPWATLVLATALGAVAFAPGARDMVGRWLAAGSYYGHGPLVPVVSAWLLWHERERLRGIARGSSGAGLVLVAGAVLVLVASLIEDVHFTQNFALLGTIAGTALVLLGAPLVRAAWFPIAYLAFMVPLPELAIAHIAFALKLLAARLSVGAIELAGIPVVLDGSVIHLATTSVTVEEVCSGLKTLIALLAVAAIFAFFERSRARAALVVVLAAPIAIFANVVRILILCALAAAGSPAAEEGPLHEATGLAVYAVAIACLLALRRVPLGAHADAGEGVAPAAGTAPPAAAAPALPAAPSRARSIALLALLGAGAAAAVAFGFETTAREKTARTRAIPLVAGGWTGADLPLAPRVYLLLETEDVLVRRFTSREHALPVDLYVVHAADSRKVAHPPEICFSGGGYLQRERAMAELPGPGGQPIPAIRMVLDDERHRLLVYYWYRLDGKDTADYVSHQLATLWRRLRRERHEASMVRLSTPVLPGDGGLPAAEARIRAFAMEALGAVVGALR